MAPSGEVIEMPASDNGSDEVEVVGTSKSSKPIPVAADESAAVASEKTALDRIRRGGLNFDGEFACLTRLEPKDAPNPFLSIDGIGSVGVPLTEREANDVRLTVGCEVAASKISFENAAWDAWIKETIGPEAFNTLVGDHGPRMAPTFVLRNLVITGPDDENTVFSHPASENQVGTLFVSLPSSHTGGALSFSFEDEVFSADIQNQSGFLTSAVASFSGVVASAAPVQTGFQASLVYDILSRPGSDPITLPNTDDIEAQLKAALETWMSESASFPSARIHILLEKTYNPDGEFCAEDLRDADEHLWKHLAPVLQDVGLHAYLAHIEVTVDADASVSSWESYADGTSMRDPWQDIEQEDFHFNIEDCLSDGKGELRVTELFDAEGTPIRVDGVEFEVADLVGEEEMTRFAPDEEKFERDSAWNASLTHVYLRTALILTKTTAEMAPDGERAYTYAVSELSSSLSDAPTPRETILVDTLLKLGAEATNDQRKGIVSTLQSCAARWKDVAVLVRALDACRVDRDVSILGMDNLVAAVKAFGWDPLRTVFDKIIENEETNLGRQLFLTTLSATAREEGNEALTLWCSEALERLLRSLRPMEGRKEGTFSPNTIIPQLDTQMLGLPFWLAFLKTVKSGIIANMSPELATALVSLGVDRAVETFPESPTTGPPDGPMPDPQPVMDVLHACLDAKHTQKIERVAQRLREGAGNADVYKTTAPWSLYAKLVDMLDEYLTREPDALNEMVVFFSDALREMLRGDGCQIVAGNYNMVLLEKAFRRAGGAFRAGYWSRRSSGDIQVLLRAVTENSPDADLSDLKASVVDTAIRSFDLSPFLPRHPATAQSYVAVTDEIVRLVQFLIDFGAQEKVPPLLTDLLALPPSGFTLAQHIDKILVPLVLDPNAKLLLTGINSFEFFCVAVLKGFVNTVFESKPHELVPATEIAGVGCSDAACNECRDVREFLGSPRDRTEFSRGGKIRRHIEASVRSRVKVWGVTLKTTTLATPHTLHLQKPAHMVDARAELCRRGLALLGQLGDAPARSRLLGADYVPISTRFVLPKKPPGAAPQVQSNSTLKRPGQQLHGERRQKKTKT
ncbi:hypothetical protein MKEN_01104900 [Mycena kentingensis (nom. inval.)]|nr:hypothetical protein MKEN_01104900 [Mycena kentingensis (nom. inval.)]